MDKGIDKKTIKKGKNVPFIIYEIKRIRYEQFIKLISLISVISNGLWLLLFFVR